VRGKVLEGNSTHCLKSPKGMLTLDEVAYVKKVTRSNRNEIVRGSGKG